MAEIWKDTICDECRNKKHLLVKFSYRDEGFSVVCLDCIEILAKQIPVIRMEKVFVMNGAKMEDCYSIQNNDEFELGAEDFTVSWYEPKATNNDWAHCEVIRQEKSPVYFNGIKYPETRLEWLNKIIFKIRYWWQFTRQIKDMRG